MSERPVAGRLLSSEFSAGSIPCLGGDGGDSSAGESCASKYICQRQFKRTGIESAVSCETARPPCFGGVDGCVDCRVPKGCLVIRHVTRGA